MSNHFAAIGLGVTDQDSFRALVSGLLERADAQPVGGDVRQHVWTGTGGARVVIETQGRSIAQVLPCLAPAGEPVSVTGVALVDDETARVGLLDGPGGTMVCPLAVDLEDRAVLRSRGGTAPEGELRLAALAERLTLHTGGKAAYEASQEGREIGFAPDFLIPYGLFRPEGAEEGWVPSAHAGFAGEVLLAEAHTGDVTGGRFHRLRVRTIAGFEVDVAVADEELTDSPVAGHWVDGEFFMTGSLGLAPAPGAARKRWWSRRS
ncbi:hypothetical protein OH779_12310 [Actinacidiphila glaucinigra]|uniref:hypothetical protein n=1 Tax=Actinacidiphila glaucinigra TaxID=235986 RepID=UPI00386A5A57